MRVGQLCLALVTLTIAAATEPAFACQFVDVGAATAEAARMALSYYAAAVVCGAILIAIEVRRKRALVLSGLSLALLVFHPYWWYSQGYTTACRFPIVTDSQVVLGAMAVMLAFRLFISRSA